MFLIVNLNPAIDRIYTIPNFRLDHIHRTGNVLAQAGGKGINVARAALVLGAKPLVTGFLSNIQNNGYAGGFVRYDLEKVGICQSWVPILGDTRSCLVIADPQLHLQTVINEQGPTIRSEEIEEMLQHFCSLLSSHFLVVITGSIPAKMTPDIYGQLVSLAHNADRFVILDAKGKELLSGIQARSDIVKVNLEEITEYSEHKDCICNAVNQGDFAPLLHHAASILSNGVQHLIVSLGSRGAIWMTQQNRYTNQHCLVSPTKSKQNQHEANENATGNSIIQAWYAPAPVIESVNAVGSGDAMAAAIAYEIEQWQRGLMPPCTSAKTCLSQFPESLIEKALISGVAAGTANATIGGLRFSRTLFDQLRATIFVEKMRPFSYPIR